MDKKNIKQAELNTKENMAQIKKAFEEKRLNPGGIAKSLKLSPQKRRILAIPKDLLIQHNALIFHKASSLSYNERKMVQERVAYCINKGTIKPQEVADEINKLNAMVQGELKKVLDANSKSE